MPAPFKLFGVAQPGLEPFLFKEMCRLGLTTSGKNGNVVTGGVEFVGHSRSLYAANIQSRISSRFLLRLGTFKARDERELTQKLGKLKLGDFFRLGDTRFKTKVTSRKSRLIHTGLITDRILDGLSKYHNAESDNVQSLVVNMFDDRMTISVDSSGHHLHERGYRGNESSGYMPLRENVAAGFLEMMDWDFNFDANPMQKFVDPFCGSGTIVIEAAMRGVDLMPGLVRILNDRDLKLRMFPRKAEELLAQRGNKVSFAFERWPCFEPDVYAAVVQDSLDRFLKHYDQRPATAGTQMREYGMVPHMPTPFLGFDMKGAMVEVARKLAKNAYVDSWTHFERSEIKALILGSEGGQIMTNPPYGPRAGTLDRLGAVYGHLGQAIKSDKWNVHVIMPSGKEPNKALFKSGLSWYDKSQDRVSNGGRYLRLHKGRAKAS